MYENYWDGHVLLLNGMLQLFYFWMVVMDVKMHLAGGCFRISGISFDNVLMSCSASSVKLQIGKIPYPKFDIDSWLPLQVGYHMVNMNQHIELCRIYKIHMGDFIFKHVHPVHFASKIMGLNFATVKQSHPDIFSFLTQYIDVVKPGTLKCYDPSAKTTSSTHIDYNRTYMMCL